MWSKLGIIPYIIIGPIFLVLGVGSLRQITNYWPFEAQNHLELVRQVATDQASNTDLIEVALPEMIVAFLLSAAFALIGLFLPLLYLINRRIQARPPDFLVICRQGLGIGLWVAVCLYLQMNRVLSIAVALLLMVVFVLAEVIFQVRTQAQNSFELAES